MPHVNLRLDGDGCWPDLIQARADGRLIDMMNEDVGIGIALLRGGMLSGNPSVTFRFDLPDGRILITQTSLALLVNSVRAMQVRAGTEDS